jgi:putative FmdB family regulatory protein
MPIYEFRCKECRHDFKTLRRADQIDSVACPTCGTREIVRLLSVTAQTAPASDGACAMPMGGG